jgi:hypothetical protein
MGLDWPDQDGALSARKHEIAFLDTGPEELLEIFGHLYECTDLP